MNHPDKSTVCIPDGSMHIQSAALKWGLSALISFNAYFLQCVFKFLKKVILE